MKSFSLYIIIAIFAGLCSTVHAQGVNSVISNYNQYVTQKDAGNMSAAYASLYNCCQSAQSLVKTVSSGSSEYNQLRTLLTNMLPDIDQAYTYACSQGNSNNATIFAQAYLDLEASPVMAGADVEHSSSYATMAYNTAARTYNAHDYKKVIPYFKAYLSTGEQKHRSNVLQFMFDACQKSKDYDSAIGIIDELLQVNSNYSTIKIAINMCMDKGEYSKMQTCLTKGLSIRPNDSELLKLQGQLYEETGMYEEAIQLFTKMKASSPMSTDINKHLAVNQYNLAVSYYNAAQSGNNAKHNNKQATAMFASAAKTLSDVVSIEKNSLKYNQALASAYLYSDQKDKMEQTNNKISALGGETIQAGMEPMAISTSSKAKQNTTSVSSYANNASSTVNSNSNVSAGTGDIPSFSEFAKSFVEQKVNQWQAKDPYETVDEYRARVTEDSRTSKVKEFSAQAQKDYIAKYSAGIKFGKELTLKPYDAENKAFLIESSLGELIVPVPRENNEARNFEKNWVGMTFSNPKYYINNDKLALAALTFTTPSGKTYQYSSDKDVAYTETKVDVKFDKIDYNILADAGKGNNNKVKHESKTVSVGQSDVDMNIPETHAKNDNTYAVVICNEHYDNVSSVSMALNDGETFSEYCQKTLGLPKENIRLYKDASYGAMLRAVKDIKSIASTYNGGLKVIFYYAGHGIPNESTKDAYLLPVDADGTQTDGCYSLAKLYEELGGMGADNVLVFLDACFSGAQRDGGMLASARGVALKAKKSDPRGNMVIFSAATDDETAMPYTDKNHGLFTYYLLKKLQESKGDVTLSDLGDYIKQNVSRKANVVNHKPQTPTVSPSSSMADKWSTMKIIK